MKTHHLREQAKKTTCGARARGGAICTTAILEDVDCDVCRAELGLPARPRLPARQAERGRRHRPV